MAKEETKKSWDRKSYISKGFATRAVSCDASFERKLKNYNKEREFNRLVNLELRDKGIAWFESGLSLEDASKEFRDDFSFKMGFEIGRRRARARELDEADKIKKSK